MRGYDKAVGNQVRFNSLIDMHNKFIDILRQQAPSQNDFGVINIGENDINIECFGMWLPLEWRPVACDGIVSLMEYRVAVKKEKEIHNILCLYLDENGSLWRDSSRSNPFYDFNNSYVHKHIMAEISEALVGSVVFRPEQ